jgi:hypothetical protein
LPVSRENLVRESDYSERLYLYYSDTPTSN